MHSTGHFNNDSLLYLNVRITAGSRSHGMWFLDKAHRQMAEWGRRRPWLPDCFLSLPNPPAWVLPFQACTPQSIPGSRPQRTLFNEQNQDSSRYQAVAEHPFRQWQADLCEFKTSLVYRASSRATETTWQNPISKNKQTNKQTA